MTIVPTIILIIKTRTGMINMPAKLLASLMVDTLLEPYITRVIPKKAYRGAIKNTAIAVSIGGYHIYPKTSIVVKLTTTIVMAKNIYVSAMDGIYDANNLPMNNSRSVSGEANNASIVFLSFSPAKLSAVTTDMDAKENIMNNIGMNNTHIMYINNWFGSIFPKPCKTFLIVSSSSDEINLPKSPPKYLKISIRIVGKARGTIRGRIMDIKVILL